MDKVSFMLDEEIMQRLHDLSESEKYADSDRDTQAINNLAALYKLRLEEKKLQNESDDTSKRFDSEKKSKRIEHVITAAEIITPVIFYGIWMRRGFKFEETGTFTSGTFRNLWSRFKPTK